MAFVTSSAACMLKFTSLRIVDTSILSHFRIGIFACQILAGSWPLLTHHALVDHTTATHWLIMQSMCFW